MIKAEIKIDFCFYFFVSEMTNLELRISNLWIISYTKSFRFALKVGQKNLDKRQKRAL